MIGEACAIGIDTECDVAAHRSIWSATGWEVIVGGEIVRRRFLEIVSWRTSLAFSPIVKRVSASYVGA